jgi:hypothetical protein
MNDLSGHFSMIGRLVQIAALECYLCGRGREPKKDNSGKWMHATLECDTAPTWDRITELEAEYKKATS